MGYIYIFTNKVNGKQYVGMTTKTIEKRMYAYKRCSKNENRPIISAIKKYGWDNFELEVKKFDNYMLLDLEEQYIKELNTLVPNGYNVLPRGGEKSLFQKMQDRKRKRLIEMCTDEEEDDIIPNEQRKTVDIYDFVEKECKKYTNGYSNFYEELANDALDIYQWLNGREELPYIKYEIKKNIKANYERRRKNEPYAAKKVDRELYDFEYDIREERKLNDVITRALRDDFRNSRRKKN